MGIFFGLIPIAVLIQKMHFFQRHHAALGHAVHFVLGLTHRHAAQCVRKQTIYIANIGTAAGKQYAGIADVCYQLG